MLSTTIGFLKNGRHSLEKVIFCLFDKNARSEFERALGRLAGTGGQGGE
jgi:hypothetical protein